MNIEYKTQLFRLAAVLYADNNYEVSPKTIHKKIIESALLSFGDKPIELNKLIDVIHENYKIHFDVHEIKGIVLNEKEESFVINNSRGETFIFLSEKRKNVLKSKISNKTIDYFIEEFETLNKQLLSGTKPKDIIYRFLYELLSTNIESFKKLLDNKKKIEELINVEVHNYDAVERGVVNMFLAWDNTEKDKAIFDIASYALEYCLISNNSTSSTIHLTELKNKMFYLDANVVFRALGINGENRQNRTITFLKKFIEANETLKISKFSEIEFKESIKFYIDKLKERPLKNRINPAVFEERYFQSISSVYNFYYKWRVGKVNDSLELFEGYIISLYEAFKNEFQVQEDYKIPFDLADEKQRQPIQEIANDISSFKTSESVSHSMESDFCDACNISLIERRRDGKNVNLFQTKFFLISTDQALRRWDYSRSLVTPVVIMPSQWLSILLRYVRRTSDDFKSFVNFLNLPLPETQIKAEKLHLILAGISEMTSNFEQQKFIANALVLNKFEGILEKGLDDDEIIERTKQFSKTALESKLDEVEDLHSSLKTEYNDHKLISQSTISLLQEERNTQAIRISETQIENIQLKGELRDRFVQDKLKSWQRLGYWLIPVVIIIALFFVLQIVFINSELNYVRKLILWIDNHPSETTKTMMRNASWGLLASIVTLGYLIYARLFSSKKRSEKIKEISDSIPPELI